MNGARQSWLVAVREIRERGRSRGFLLSVVVMLVGVAGGFLFTGAMWARAVTVVMAGLAMIVNFLWIPYYPIWSLLTIAFLAFVVWAVTAHGRDITAEG